MDDDEDYEREHGVPRPTDTSYNPPSAAPTSGPRQQSRTSPAFPSQTEELQELGILAKDAAEIMWEMVALGEGGQAVEDMRSRALQLQAQLRGMLSDYTEGDEAVLMNGLESFDMLTRCLDGEANEVLQQQQPQQDQQPGLNQQTAPALNQPLAATDDLLGGLNAVQDNNNTISSEEQQQSPTSVSQQPSRPSGADLISFD